MIPVWRRRKVRLHFEDAPSIEGVLVSKAGAHYHLRAPALLESSEATRALEGDALVPKFRVYFVQVLG